MSNIQDKLDILDYWVRLLDQQKRIIGSSQLFAIEQVKRWALVIQWHNDAIDTKTSSHWMGRH